MTPFTTLTAIACPLGLANVDTDQLIPARFMSRPRKEGYGSFLLHDMRFDEAGTLRGFVLDSPAHAGASVLIARRNFGTGSSREAAVYALVDFGIRCVIAPSFGDIFAANAVKNGLLPAQVEEAEAERLLAAITAEPARHLTIDLAGRSIRGAGSDVPFAIDPVRALQLLNGWDDLDMTLRYEGEIAAYRARRRALAPWSVPARR